MEYQHFSYRHLLIPLHFDEESEEIKCIACERLIINSESFHGCLSCKYFLHDQCLNLPRWLHHPSHNSHPLTLLPTPTYPYRSYSCNECESLGSSFSFSCAQCEFDLHTECANLARTVVVDAHPRELIWLVQSLLMHTLVSLSSPMRFLVMIMFPLCVMCVVVEWTSGFGCTDVLIKGLDQNQRLETQEMVGGQARANGGLDPIRKGANQMMEDQLETMRLQNQLNRTRMIANLMTWTWR
uniref:DC1 domain-containing protein n=1 Tax=Manihot esculenta TaxID=3983 RepID=A0A2C9VIT5_MANES